MEDLNVIDMVFMNGQVAPAVGVLVTVIKLKIKFLKFLLTKIFYKRIPIQN